MTDYCAMADSFAHVVLAISMPVTAYSFLRIVRELLAISMDMRMTVVRLQRLAGAGSSPNAQTETEAIGPISREL